MAVPFRNSRSIRAWPSAASPPTAFCTKSLIAGSVDDGGAGKALPAARLQHHEILQRGLDARLAGRRRARHRRDIFEPPALAAQLLALAAGHGALKVSLALRAGREQGAFVAAEGGARRPWRASTISSASANGALLGDERQQKLRRHRRVGPEMIEPGGDHRLRLVAIDQRRAERRVGMRPADQHRREAAAPAADTRREQAGEPAAGGPHQHGADIRAEHRRRGERKRRFVEHVGLERTRGELAPFLGDGFRARRRCTTRCETLG